MGDPSGIGPEVCIRSLDREILSECQIFITGSISILNEAIQRFHTQSFSFVQTDKIQKLPENHIGLIPCSDLDFENCKVGKISKASGQAAFNAIQAATDLCKNKQAQAMVTAPVSKEAIEKTGIEFRGHTEWIANRCGCRDEMMMMSSQQLQVGYVTTHLALNDVSKHLSIALIIKRLKLMQLFLTESKHSNQKIAVCGLNPHAGEGGLLGLEDLKLIQPAIQEAKEMGIDCEGPFPADTIFVESLRKKYGAILAMYHDQGGIPFKMLSFEDGVNHTLGLPIIRTSVDHGTAWDLAWKGVAHTGSMKSAIKMAQSLAHSRFLSSKTR